MSRSRWLVAAGAVAFLATGCQGAISELHPGREELNAATKGSLGQVLVDDEGRTVYLFEKDDEPDESYCHGACESVWPPVTTSQMPEVRGPVDASQVTLLTREDGLKQVVYAGHPLYYYQGDTSRADTNGQEKDQFGAEWYVLNPSGQAAEAGEEGGEYDES